MKIALLSMLLLGSISASFAYDDEYYDEPQVSEFNTEAARDVLESGIVSDEFLEAKARLQMAEDRANLTDEEAAMMLLTTSDNS